ncbi:hypothetical protein ARMGADRAFT_451423 [Armillaria gallica]|uniref:Uncharacterized protein n=1 Tax=Armillaria gallica TaxID=47427 RepID=A0A2H3DHE7_ARMGA|nr:hypothetical protein ARMGADRAFT_451423 [Armillaria gallica]
MLGKRVGGNALSEFVYPSHPPSSGTCTAYVSMFPFFVSALTLTCSMKRRIWTIASPYCRLRVMQATTGMAGGEGIFLSPS